MYRFILNMWCMKKVTAEQVENYIDKGFITKTEADEILGTPQLQSEVE
jgi:hypothetical protein